MKFIFYSFVNIFVILTSIAFSAPVGNIGAPLLWGEGFLVKEGLFHVTVAVDFDLQKNSLDRQIKRFAWEDPAQANPETRHYEQIRSSENKLTSSGITIGGILGESAIIYLLAGVCKTTVDLNYLDKTMGYGFETQTEFKSEDDFYYGAGLSVIMHEGTYKDDIPIKVGMDVKYRKFEIEDDNLSSKDEFYSASLDEIQMAFVLSAEKGPFCPYIGARISSITGKEHYIDRNYASTYFDSGYIDYANDITWFKNIGYLAGISFYIKELCLLNLEIRRGDEDAIGLSSTIKF